MIKEIFKSIEKAGGKAFYVGGCVRDIYTGKQPKDIDVEIYGIEFDDLFRLLSQYGEVNTIGKSFGILKISGIDVDFSMPRKERNTGLGHKNFAVTVDPYMSYEDACRRRDISINSMLMSTTTGDIIDCFNGREDIERKVIKHVDAATFIEDPLRVYRVVQFAGRFNFTIAPETLDLCRSIDLSSLPKERIYEELMKLLMKSERPSIGFEYMRELGLIEKYYPTLHNLIDCMQPEVHHPEGSVWNHTMLTLDYAAKLKDKSKNPEAFMLAALLHDVGKPDTMRITDGKITFYGHDRAGEPLAVEFLQSITNDKKLISLVSNLVKYHMNPIALYNSMAPDSAVKKFANKCDIKEIVLLHEADHNGRDIFNDFVSSPVTIWINNKIEKFSLDKKIQPIVRGNDLISLGLKPSPEFGVILKKAYDMQLEGIPYEEIMDTIKQNL